MRTLYAKILAVITDMSVESYPMISLKNIQKYKNQLVHIQSIMN